MGDIHGFFALGRGRPPKVKRKPKDAEHPVLELQEDSKRAEKKNKSRTTYLDYNNPNTKAALDRAVAAKLRADSDGTALYRAVTAKLRADSDETETYLTGGPFIPPSTVRHHTNKENLVTINYKREYSDLFVK